MKKISNLFIVLVLFVSLFVLVGCRNNKQDNKSEEAIDSKGDIYLLLETEGLGQVSYYIDDVRKIDFNDERPNQQVYIKLDKAENVKINCKADAGYKFVKWTKDNKDYSTDSELEITVSGTTELTAVFDENV